MLLLSLMPLQSGQGKAAPGCGATVMAAAGQGSIGLGGDNASRRSLALEGTLGASSATSPAGSVQCIQRQLVTLAV